MRLAIDKDINWEADIDDVRLSINKAARVAIEKTAARVTREARQEIGRGGMSPKFQKGLRSLVFVNPGKDPEFVAFIFHSFPFSGVFEEGATIIGKPYLWLPTKNAPRVGGRQVGPAGFRRSFGRLASSRRGSRGRPLLFGKLPGKDKPVPVFVAIPIVQIRKRYSVSGLIESGLDRHFIAEFDKALAKEEN